jgi:hypothetical protein
VIRGDEATGFGGALDAGRQARASRQSVRSGVQTKDRRRNTVRPPGKQSWERQRKSGGKIAGIFRRSGAFGQSRGGKKTAESGWVSGIAIAARPGVLVRRDSEFGLLRDIEKQMRILKEVLGGMVGASPQTLGRPSTGSAESVA